MSGDDSLTLPFLSVGAVGVVSVASNLFPAEVVSLVQPFRAGDTKSARGMHLKLLPLFKDLFIEPNPVPAKTALAWRGAMSAECRLPLCEMTPANEARWRKTLEAFERRDENPVRVLLVGAKGRMGQAIAARREDGRRSSSRALDQGDDARAGNRRLRRGHRFQQPERDG